MAEIMGQRYGFSEVLIQPERAGDVPRDGRDCHGMREPRAQMIACPVQEDLRLILETAEGARMNHPLAIALVLRPPVRRRFFELTAERVGAELSVRREREAFELLQFKSRAGHES